MDPVPCASSGTRRASTRTGRATLVILMVSLAGCSSRPQHGAVFYPVNPNAKAIGVLMGDYQASGPRSGSLRAVMPGGEVLTGQYVIVSADASGFGSIHASALTPLSAPGAVYGQSRMAERSSPCRATLFGDRGTSMECEFYNDNVFHHGYGGCRSSRGAVFRLQF